MSLGCFLLSTMAVMVMMMMMMCVFVLAWWGKSYDPFIFDSTRLRVEFDMALQVLYLCQY